MRLQLLGMVAAFGLLAACGTETQQAATTTAAGTKAQAAPAAAAPAANVGIAQDSIRYFVANVGDRVFFDTDKSDLRPDAVQVLNRQATWLKANPKVTIRIEGHADERGTREYNLALGERRAHAAAEYLISQGVDKARVATISYGKERPVAAGNNEDAWKQNRRAVTTLVAGYSN